MIAQYGVATPFSGGQFGGDLELKQRVAPHEPGRMAEPDARPSRTLARAGQVGQVGQVAQLPIRHPGSAGDMQAFWNIKPHYRSPFEAFIPIQNGCDKFCTFCAVPYTRGREVSRPSSEILEEVRNLIGKGYRSITLLGQNVNSYGQDKGRQEMSFPSLMREIGELGRRMGREHNFWVYFTSPHPGI